MEPLHPAAAMEEQINFMHMYPYQTGVPQVPSLPNNWQISNLSQTLPFHPAHRAVSENVSESQEDQQALEDSFGLEFAAIQWLQLVTNAEKLFKNLLQSILLTVDEKTQIERWLCLKQECEECVASEATSLAERQGHSLGRIDELTEDPDEIEGLSDFDEKSTDSQYESESESDFDSHHPDFEYNMYVYMGKFKDKTDMLINKKLAGDYVTIDNEENSKPVSTSATSSSPAHRKGRRKSLQPESIHSFMFDLSNKGSCLDIEVPEADQQEKGNEGDNLPLVTSEIAVTLTQPCRELKSLFLRNERKKSCIHQITAEIEGTNNRLKEVEEIIESKEKFIKDLIKNSSTRASAKLKCEREFHKRQEKYFKTRAQLAQAESALNETKGGSEIEVLRQKKEVRKYKDLARKYEKKLMEIDKMKGITKDSAKKVVELEESLMESKKEKTNLEKQLRQQEEKKVQLEKEFIKDKQKIQALEEKYKIGAAGKLWERGKLSDGNKDDCLKEQEVKLNTIKERVHSEQFQLDYREEKCEADLRRKEIRNLREARDCLLEKRTSLEGMNLSDHALSPVEERIRLEWEEEIEAIDTAIEHKNELICLRKSMDIEEKRRREHGEQMLIDRLLNLSLDEMKTLFYKYFQRVIDLKANGKKLERQINELEDHNYHQAADIERLRYHIYVEHMKSEREKVDIQRENQEKLHLMLRQYAEESSSSGTEAGKHLLPIRDSELSKYKRENKILKRRLQDMEALRQTAAASRGVRRIRSRSASPEQGVLKPSPTPSSTTKMIREKNKVIISFSTPKSTYSSKGAYFNNHKS